MLWTLALGCTGMITLEGQDAAPPLACEHTVPPSLSLEPVWTESLDIYGEWGGIHAFSPDGRQVVSAADVYDPVVVTLDTVDGHRSEATDDVYPWARDEDWTYEVRGTGWDGGAVVELATGQVVLERDELGDAWRGGHGVLSGDGESVASVDCDDGVLTIQSWSIASGARIGELELPGLCSWSPPNPSQVALTRNGEALYVGLAETGEVLRIGLRRGTADLWQAHGPPEEDGAAWFYSGLVHEVRLGPDEQVLVTAGVDGWLQRWSTETLEPASDPVSVGWTNVNENIYANPWSFAPSAESPDGTLLFTLDEDGAGVVRWACDGQILAALATPEPPETGWYDDVGPVRAAWSRSGDQLAVRYEGVVSLWEVARD